MKKMIVVATLALLSFGVTAQASSSLQDQLPWWLMIDAAQIHGVAGKVQFAEKLLLTKFTLSERNAIINFPEKSIDEDRVLGQCGVAVQTDRLQVVISAGREFDLVDLRASTVRNFSRGGFQELIAMEFAGSDGRFGLVECRLINGRTVSDLQALLSLYGIGLDLTELYELEVFTPEFIQFFAPDTDR